MRAVPDRVVAAALALALMSVPALCDACRAKLHGVTRRWRDLDAVVAKHPGGPVSGGIFLYQRQSSLLSELVRSQAEAAQAAGRARRFLVCETGFGAGHSAALFLESSPSVDVVTFSLMTQPYAVPAAKMLQKKYPGRYSYVPGDSCETVPTYEGQCDFLHGSSLCSSDNIDLVGKVGCGVQLTSTAILELDERSVYFGPRAQWTVLRDAGCIEHIQCYAEAALELDRSFIFQHKGGKITHKFCTAVTTGRCIGRGPNATRIGALVDPKFDRKSDRTSVPCEPLGVPMPGIELCKEHMVAVPESNSSTKQLATVVITSYSTTGFRKRWLRMTTKMYTEGVYRTLVDRVIVVWNNPDAAPPKLPDGVLVLKMTTNSLNHRWTEVIPHVRTESVLNLDDDIFVSKSGIECLLNWRAAHPDRLVGPFVRVTKHGKYVIDELFGAKNAAQSYEMVLPRIVMLGKQHLEAYKSMPVATREYVDTQEAHCDDIAMNLAAAAMSQQPPFRTMLPRGSVVDYYATCWTDFKNGTGGLGLQKDRAKLRSECLAWLLGKYPAGTLKTSNAVGICDLDGSRLPLQPNQGGNPVEWRQMSRDRSVASTCKET